MQEHFIEEREEKYTVFNGGTRLTFANSMSLEKNESNNSVKRKVRMAGGLETKLKSNGKQSSKSQLKGYIANYAKVAQNIEKVTRCLDQSRIPDKKEVSKSHKVIPKSGLLEKRLNSQAIPSSKPQGKPKVFESSKGLTQSWPKAKVRQIFWSPSSKQHTSIAICKDTCKQ